MPETIRFHADENVRSAVVLGLRRLGIDVTAAAEVGLLSASDQQQLAFAHRERRVLFTHDSDFLKLHSRGIPHAGIVYCHHEARSVGEILRSLKLIWAIYESDEMVNRVEYA